MNHKEKIGYVFVFVFVIIGIFWAHIDSGSFKKIYTGEDGFIEWMTVIALGMNSIYHFYQSYHFKKKKSYLPFFVTLFIGIIFLFGTGEEISWGQRIFDVKAGDFFLQNNSQRETNIHNLVLFGIRFNKVIFGKLLALVVFTYFIIFPLVYRKNARFQVVCDDARVPVPSWFHSLAILLVFLGAELTLSARKGEIMEFASSWILLLTMCYPYNSFRWSESQIQL